LREGERPAPEHAHDRIRQAMIEEARPGLRIGYRLKHQRFAYRCAEPSRDIERVLFVLANMVESLSHAAAIRRPPRLSLAAAKEVAVRAVLAYLRL
jgi:hypothetical protein